MSETGQDKDQKFLDIAYSEALKGYEEGGIPIGAVLVSGEGEILGQGHNKRIQDSSATLHAEMDALENAGRLAGKWYKDATMYTTLSPCDMCTGACLMYGVSRVVLGENKTFVGGEAYLKQRGVQVKNLHDDKCFELIQKFIKEKPSDWNEDIGVEE